MDRFQSLKEDRQITFELYQSDNGGEFKNQILQAVIQQLGGKAIYSSSRHPQTNGAIERLNQTQSTIKMTPFFAEFGKYPEYKGDPRLELIEQEVMSRQEIDKVIHQRIVKNAEKMKKRYDSKKQIHKFEIGDKVLVRAPVKMDYSRSSSKGKTRKH